MKRRSATIRRERTAADIVGALLRDLEASGFIAHQPRSIEEQLIVVQLVIDGLVGVQFERKPVPKRKPPA